MTDETMPPGQKPLLELIERERRLAELDESIARGIADADAGRVQDIEAVRRELRERFAAKPLSSRSRERAE